MQYTKVFFGLATVFALSSTVLGGWIVAPRSCDAAPYNCKCPVGGRDGSPPKVRCQQACPGVRCHNTQGGLHRRRALREQIAAEIAAEFDNAIDFE